MLILRCVGLATLLTLGTASPSYAAYPGRNGEIAVEGLTYATLYSEAFSLIWHFYPDGSFPRKIGPGPDNPNYDNSNVLSAAEYSPSGTRIAFEANLWNDAHYDVWTTRADGTGWKRLTSHPAYDGQPTWSPNGRRIAFTSSRDGELHLYIMDREGQNVRRVPRAGLSVGDIAWSPAGGRIAFQSDWDLDRKEEMDHPDLWSIRPDGTGLIRLTNDEASQGSFDWAPDGSRIAYSSKVVGADPEIITIEPDGSDPISLGPGGAPAYSPDGKWMAYWDGELMRMRPDGTRRSLIRKGNEELDIGGEISWQPWNWTRSSRVEITKIRRRASTTWAARGLVEPLHRRQKVIATLYKRSGSRFVKLAREEALTRYGGWFRIRFKNFERRGCLLRIRFVGDADHSPSVARKRLTC